MDGSSSSRLAFDNATPAEILHSAFHIGQTVSTLQAGGLEPATVILNGDREQQLSKIDADRQFRSVGMFHDVMHRLLNRHGNVVAGLARNLNLTRQNRDIE